MTTQEQIRKVTDIAQEKGWSINVEDENKTSIQFEFQRYTINPNRYCIRFYSLIKRNIKELNFIIEQIEDFHRFI